MKYKKAGNNNKNESAGEQTEAKCMFKKKMAMEKYILIDTLSPLDTGGIFTL